MIHFYFSFSKHPDLLMLCTQHKSCLLKTVLFFAFEGNNNHLIIDPSSEQLFKVNSYCMWNSEWISKEYYSNNQPCPIFFRSWVSCLTLQTSKKMFQTFQPKLTHFYKRDGEPSKKYLWCCWTVINYKEENNLQKKHL